MKPGKELDALVAEKVMGWKREGLWWIDPDGYRWEINTPEALDLILPDYSTDIAAAFEVVAKLNPKDDEFRLSCFQQGDWFCTFAYFDGQSSRAATPAHAICLAALKAVSSEPR